VGDKSRAATPTANVAAIAVFVLVMDLFSSSVAQQGVSTKSSQGRLNGRFIAD
jgi:hypothetical protein